MFHSELTAQCPEVEFHLYEASICQNEYVGFVNDSNDGAVGYEWDFCVGDLASSPVVNSSLKVANTSTLSGTAIVDSLLFVCSRGTNEIFIYNYGVSLGSSSPELVAILNDPLFSGPEWLEFKWEGDRLIGYVLNLTGQNITRVIINDLYSGDIRYEDLGNLGGLLKLPRGLDLVSSGNERYLFVTDQGANQFYRVPIMDSWSGALDLSNISTFGAGSGLSAPIGISITRSCDQWYGLVSSFSSGQYYHLSFGSDLGGPITVTDLGVSATNPTDVVLVNDGGEYFGYGTGRGGNVYRMSFGNDLATLDSFEDLGDYGGAVDEAFGFEMVLRESQWSIFSANQRTNVLTRLDFTNDCFASSRTSSEFEPRNISYSAPGTYQIGLKVTDENGNTRSTRRSVTVSEDTAPPISFRTLAIACATSEATFAVEAEQGDFDSYVWDFGDGSTATGTEVTHKFTAAGDYDVSVTGTSPNGCSNTELRSVNIFASPLDPAFELEAEQYCVNAPIALNNLTNESGYDPDVVRYLWTIGEWESDEKSPVITIDSAGKYTLSMFVNIEGCESEPIEKTFEIKPTVEAGFRYSAGCQEVPVIFENLSEATAISHTWDFGDGYSSTEFAPSHFYEAGGIYEVALTVTNAEGCVDTYSEAVEIAALPEPYFEYDLLCEGQPVVLQDLSEVGHSNIVAWEWYIADELVSVEQRAEVTFGTAGTEVVRLVVRAENGCEASYSRAVDVLEMPPATFGSTIGCLGQISTFTDLTRGQEQVAGRSWFVNGHLVSGQTAAQFDSAFSEPGLYDIMLVVNHQNFCSASFSQTVEISPAPLLDFEVNGTCTGETIRVVDRSVSGADAIVSRSWLWDGMLIGNGSQAQLGVAESGSYELALVATTADNCVFTTSRVIEVYSSPKADFVPSVDFGIPPFRVSFTNRSANAATHHWYVDGEWVTDEANPEMTFQDEGMKEVSLVVANEEGCTDSMHVTINSAMPVIDLVLKGIQLVQDGAEQRILLDIGNQSNMPVEGIQARITLEGNFEVTETVEQRIDVGQQSVVTLRMGVPVDRSRLSYLCVSLISPYGVEDQVIHNNENCISLAEKAVVEPPFPNPASERITLRALLPEGGNVDLSLVDMTGQLRYRERLLQRPKGLNIFLVELLTLEAGTYFLILSYGDETYKIRIIKR